MSSGFSYPQPIFESPVYNPAFYLTLDASGYLTYDYGQTLYLDKNDYRLTYITGITPGTATQGIALVPGTNNDVSGIGALSCSSLTVGGSAVAAPPAYVIGVVPGKAANNKALVLGASGEIGTISSLTATSITGTLQTSAQTNITSLGTLSGLTIDGNLTFSGVSRSITGLSSLSATSLTGTLQTSAQTNITSLGTLSGLTIGGNLTFSGASRSITGLSSLSATSLTGTLQTAAQTNITSLGTLSGLTSTGAISITATGSNTALPVLSCYGPAFYGYGSTILLSQSDASRTAYGSIYAAAYRLGDGSILDFQDVSGTISLYAHASFLHPRLTNSPSTSIITTATTCYISGAPVDAGSGYTTISNPYALYIASGASLFGGAITRKGSAGSALTITTAARSYDLQFQNESNVIGSTCGISFTIHQAAAGATTTPTAAIIARATQTGSSSAHRPSDISFYIREYQIQPDGAMQERMRIHSDGKFSFGDIGDGQWNFLRALSSCSMRFGTDLSAKNCYTMSWTYVGAGNNSHRLSFNTFGTSNTLCLTAQDRVCIGGEAPESRLHVVSSGSNLYGSWERAQEWWNDNASPMMVGLIIYNENGGTNTNGCSFGTYTNDPLNFMIGGSNRMQLNSSSRLNINRSSGPEATLHAGGMVWADEYFHSKSNIDGKAVYRTNWSQSNFLAWGTDATIGAMRLGTCDASFNWVSYSPIRGGSYTNASDRRIKQGIIDIPYGLAEVLRMQPRKFAMRFDGSQHIGFIAQEIADIIPECVSGVESTDDELNESGEPINPMGIDLASLVSVLCKAIQEQQSQIDELRAIISE